MCPVPEGLQFLINFMKQTVIGTQMRSFEHHSFLCICLVANCRCRSHQDHRLLFHSCASGLDSGESPCVLALCQSTLPSLSRCHAPFPNTPLAHPGVACIALHSWE